LLKGLLCHRLHINIRTFVKVPFVPSPFPVNPLPFVDSSKSVNRMLWVMSLQLEKGKREANE